MAGFLEPISPTRLTHSALIRGEELSLPQFDYAMLCCPHSEAWPFLDRNRGGVYWEVQEGGGGKEMRGKEGGKIVGRCKINKLNQLKNILSTPITQHPANGR